MVEFSVLLVLLFSFVFVCDSTFEACKRGVAYSFDDVTDLTALSQTHWWYNWSPVRYFQTISPKLLQKPDDTSILEESNAEFVPMLWNGNFDIDTVVSQIPAGSTVLLGFNEPNFYSQANMSPEEAAAKWPDVEEVAKQAGDLYIASPAVNYCGGGCWETDPVVYLRYFFGNCSGCKVDFVAVHCYMCYPSALEWYLTLFDEFELPIILSEFACGESAYNTPDQQVDLMTEAMEYLDNSTRVYRYAWYSARADNVANVNLLAGTGELTSLGELYSTEPAVACIDLISNASTITMPYILLVVTCIVGAWLEGGFML